MKRAPVIKGSGLVPIDDKPVHVFGMNLEERVIESRGDENKNEHEEEEPNKEDDVETIKKRKFDAITGEENEQTVFQGDFKLFRWNTANSNWTEKGRGQLKMNDSIDTDKRQSRLIMRTGGTFRIVLNVAIKHSSFRVISNTKTSLRFTDSVNVWAASGSNASQLATLIQERLEDSNSDANDEASPAHKEASEHKSEPKDHQNASEAHEVSKGESEEDNEEQHTAEPKAEPIAEPKAKPKAEPEPELKKELHDEPNDKSESELDDEHEGEPDEEPDDDAKLEPKSDVKLKSEAEPKLEAQADSESGNGTEEDVIGKEKKKLKVSSD